jgi:hypothetical protein
MQDRVGARDEEARSLANVGQKIKEALPALAHREHAVRRVAVQKERLAKDGQLPMGDEK